MSVALGWMCLTDLPVPDEPPTMLDGIATHETAQLIAPLPWMREAEDSPTTALTAARATSCTPTHQTSKSTTTRGPDHVSWSTGRLSRM